MGIRTTLADEVAEETTPVLHADLLDEDGALVTSGLTAVVLTLKDRSGNIINSRNEFDVTGSVSAGHLAFRLATADLALQASEATVAKAPRIATLEWSWSGGNRKGKAEIQFDVRNMAAVP